MLTWDYYPNEFEINVLGGASTVARHGEKTYTCKSKQLIRFYFSSAVACSGGGRFREAELSSVSRTPLQPQTGSKVDQEQLQSVEVINELTQDGRKIKVIVVTCVSPSHKISTLSTLTDKCHEQFLYVAILWRQRYWCHLHSAPVKAASQLVVDSGP